MATNLNEAGINKPRGKKREKNEDQELRKKRLQGEGEPNPTPFLCVTAENKDLLKKDSKKEHINAVNRTKEEKLESKNPKSRGEGKGD